MDYGEVRIGVAISDPTQILASPLTTIANNKRAVDNIRELAEEYQASTLIVGYPLNLKGKSGFSTAKVDDFIGKLERLKLKIVRWDERFSSASARDLLHQAGVKIGKNKGRVDRSAAAVILQHYLDSQPGFSSE